MTVTRDDTATALASLQASLRGTVIGPEDAEYDAARRVFLGDVDGRPAAIARVADTEDVARVIEIARESGLELAVRSGGHSAAGHSTTDGGIVLDLHDLTSLDIDADDRSAWAGGGLTAGAYSSAVGAQGLATGFGDTASVGIGGITLGGGIGYLVRKHGLTIDSLLGAEIITADGRARVVDAEHEPDLFWALRGGGGNFGVVTRFRYRLHPLPEAFGGLLVLPATAETIAGFLAAAEAAPDELSTIANVMPCPPLPFVAEEHHGRLVIFGILLFAGDPADGQRAVAPFRALATPLGDLLRPMPYAEIYPPEDESYRPLAFSRTLFTDHIDESTAANILERLAAIDAPMRVAQLRALGGAMARVPPDATAFAHRDSRLMVSVAAFYGGPEDLPEKQAWVEDLAADLRQGAPRAYVNFLADEGEARIHDAYPGATWDRLAAIKAAVDPDNLFHLNQNVRPAQERAR